jgi:hypothetical protein
MMPFSPKPPMPSWTRPCGLSESHEIMLAGLRFRPSLSGALFAPDHGALLVADLHLEQGAALARRGVAVPPYDTGLTLAALEAVIAETAPRILYFLGDSFHDDTVGHSLLDDVAFLRIRTIDGPQRRLSGSAATMIPRRKTRRWPGRHAAQARILVLSRFATSPRAIPQRRKSPDTCIRGLASCSAATWSGANVS